MSNATKTYNYTSLGIALSFVGPALAVDIERITQSPGVCEEMFMQQYAYQQRGPSFREAFAEAVEAFTGVKRLTENKGTEAEPKIVFAETEQQYLNRLTTSAAEGVPPVLAEADKLRIAYEVNASLGDWSPVSVSDRKPGAQFYTTADSILAKIASEQTTRERVIANIEQKLNISFDSVYGDFNRDNLARAVKAIHEAAVKAAGELG